MRWLFTTYNIMSFLKSSGSSNKKSPSVSLSLDISSPHYSIQNLTDTVAVVYKIKQMSCPLSYTDYVISQLENS